MNNPPQIMLILFFVFLAWQVITAIINHVNTKKEQDRAREMAQRRRHSPTRVGPRGGQTSGADVGSGVEGDAGGPDVRGPDVGGPETRLRLDDVLARRRAQLEELRSRREVRRESRSPASFQQTQLRTGAPGGAIRQPSPFRMPVPPPPTTGRSGQGEMQVPSRRLSPGQKAEQVRARQEAIRRAHEQQQRQMRAEAVRAEEERQQLERDAARRRSRSRQAAADRLAAQQAIAASHRLATDIRAALRRTSTLRQAVVLKELLDSPVALRDSAM